ncbi:MAG: hypothetical protein AAF721_30335 [Myxococcota bacterium]
MAVHRRRSSAVRLGGSWLAATLLAACPDPQATKKSDPQTTVPSPASVVVHEVDGDPTHVRVHHAEALVSLDLSKIRTLDLAMSETDRVGQLADADATTVCDKLDLLQLAQRAPGLEALRISGCPAAVHAGLGAFAKLQRLELADLAFDGVTIGAVAQLSQLRSLTLVRVTATADPLRPLRALPLREIVLRSLDKDSEVTRMLDLWPRSLSRVVLEGAWAGHEAMLTLAKAEALEELELRGTRVANFSLNQIKGLSRLRSIVFEGSTFNDKSPLYFRELPMTHFVCNCSRFGDGGLRSLRHSEGLQHVELRESSITGAGLDVLKKLDLLETLIILDRDIGSEGFAALTQNESLRELELSGPLEDTKLSGLGALQGLQRLRLRHPDITDRSAAELGKLVALEALDVSNTKITDEGLEPLGKLTKLRELRLGRTRVTKRGLQHLVGLTQLQTLHLDHTDVVDEGVAALAGLPSLRELRLDHTLVTDAVLDTVLSFDKLERLSLAHTVVTRSAVAKLEALPALDAIDIEGIRE